MSKVELIYFTSCPHIETARANIRAAGVTDFVEVNVDSLEAAHRYQRFSSPAILVNGKTLVGSEVDANVCSTVDWKSVPAKIREHLASSQK